MSIPCAEQKENKRTTGCIANRGAKLGRRVIVNAGYGQRKRSAPLRLPCPIPRCAYSGKVYPNGEFTIGYVGVKKKAIADSRYERGEVNGVIGVSPELDTVDTTLGSIAVPHHERTFATLTLSTPQNHHNEKKKYGLNGITAFGRRMVRNAAERIQSVNGLRRTGFFTLTLPDYPDCINKVICQNWGHLVRKYFQELKREHERHNKYFCYVSVTEIQSKRWIESGNPGYHIHYVTPTYKLSSKRGDYFITTEWIRQTWGRILQNLIDTISLDGVNFVTPLPRVGAETIRESASAYLSKYMSKGSEAVAEVVEDRGSDQIPGQWWSVSTNLKKWVISHISQLSSNAIDIVFYLLKGKDNADILYSSQIYVECPMRGDVCVAVSGRMSASLRTCILQT